MFRLLFVIVLLFLDRSSVFGAQNVASPSSSRSPFFVVLKLDDMRAVEGRVPPRWRRVIEFSEARDVKTSIGVICDSLEGDSSAYFAELRRLASSPLFELWHHGHDHARWTEQGKTFWEFKGPDEAHQTKHLEEGLRLAKEKIGVTFTTFGAPFNATDATTARVLGRLPDITVWLYGDAAQPAGKFVARRIDAVNIETPVHVPNLAALKSGLEKHHAENCFVIQGHPNSWGEKAFEEFTRIVDHLAAQGAVFILPRDLPAVAAAATPASASRH